MAAAGESGCQRCICLEDHALIGRWLEAALPEAHVQLAERIVHPRELRPAVERSDARLIVSDVILPGEDPFSQIEDIRLQRPDVMVMFLSASTAVGHIRSALRARASGYFSKMDEPHSIVAGVRAVLSGQFAFGRSVIEAWPALAQYSGQPARWPLDLDPEGGSRLDFLTTRELEVLRLMAMGLHRAAIARTLHRSPKTIDKHRAAIMRKLDIHDRAEIVLYAVREGLVEAH